MDEDSENELSSTWAVLNPSVQKDHDCDHTESSGDDSMCQQHKKSAQPGT